MEELCTGIVIWTVFINIALSDSSRYEGYGFGGFSNVNFICR